MASATAERILEKLREVGKEGLTSPELVEALGVPKGSVTRAVNGLEAEQLVRRDGERVKPVLRRGRRLISTEERDEHAFKRVQDSGDRGLSVQELAGLLDVSRGLAYQSIYRLRQRGRIYRRGATRTATWVSYDTSEVAA